MVMVLGILGSPRPHGNAAILLEAFLDGARDAGAETALLDITGMDISGCKACNACSDTGICVVDDDMKAFYDALERADVLVLATPLYFSGMSSQLKAMIDRCQCLWQMVNKGIVPGPKRGYLLSVGAMKNANFKNVSSEVRSFFKGIGISFLGEITVSGVEAEGDIKARPEELARAYRIGREIASDPTGDTH